MKPENIEHMIEPIINSLFGWVRLIHWHLLISNVLTGMLYILLFCLFFWMVSRFNPIFANFINTSDSEEPKKPEEPLHLRKYGYRCEEASSYFKSLHNAKQDGQLDKYRTLLNYDYIFATVYFIALLFMMHISQVTAIYSNYIYILPVLYLVADFSENNSLIRAIDIFKRTNEEYNIVGSDDASCSLCHEISKCYVRGFQRLVLKASLGTVAKIWLLILSMYITLLGAFSEKSTLWQDLYSNGLFG